MEKKINIAESHPHSLTNNLLHEVHNIGGFRDKGDFEIAKHHVYGTLLTIKDLLENCEWTKEELLEFINSNIDGLELFKVKE
jgi:hypothetical protein